MPGKDPGGVIITAIIGIAASLLPTWAGQTLFCWNQKGPSAVSIAAVIGSITLV